MSQEELCMGLCESPTMSKIEKGRQYPNKKLLDALLVRLQEQAELRAQYLKDFREGLRQQLENTYIQYEDGRKEKLTPKQKQ